jgi:UTP--glucose-1-phosphate uridylyltransferase
MTLLDTIDDGTRAILEQYGFDEALFLDLSHRVAQGELSPGTNVVAAVVEPPAPGDLDDLPEPDGPAYERAHEAGLEAIRAGRVAAVVLAGGMATRFGGVVKGVVEALDGRSFLEWKLGEVQRLAGELGAEIPVALMTSFQTDEATRAHVAARGLPEPVWFSQYVSLRLERDGSLFRDAEGRVSPYGPGHGDVVKALPASGALAALRSRGVEVVTVSNVDNLGARVDPVVIGMHLLGGAPLTLEVARKEGDMGGAPVRVDGRPVMLEAPRFPHGFDHDTVGVFNTNTAVLDVDVLDAHHELTWLYVERRAGDRTAVQLERLYHELSWFVPTRFLVVPRRGPRGRFFPIKTPDDLVRSRDDLRTMLSTTLQ